MMRVWMLRVGAVILALSISRPARALDDDETEASGEAIDVPATEDDATEDDAADEDDASDASDDEDAYEEEEGYEYEEEDGYEYEDEHGYARGDEIDPDAEDALEQAVLAEAADPSGEELASAELTLEIATLVAASEDCTTADWTSAMLYFDAAALGGLAAYNAASPRFADGTTNDVLVGLSIGLASLSLLGATLVAAGACRANRPMSDSWSSRPRTVAEARAYREAASVRGGTFSIRELSTATANRDWPIFVFFLHVAATMGVFIPTLAVPDDQGWLAAVTSGVLMGAVVYGVVSLGQQLSQASNRAWVRRRIIEHRASERAARATVVPFGSPTSAGLMVHVTH